MSGFFNIDDTNNEEYCVAILKDVDEGLETMRIEEEPPINGNIQPIETFAAYESATNFKGFEALHGIVLDQFLCSDVQTEFGHMHAELRKSLETF